MSWLDLFLQLFLAAAVYAVIQVVSRIWENRQACRVPADRAAPENNENPVAEDKPPAVKSQKSPDKLSVIVKIMGSEKQLVIDSSPSDRVIDVKSKIQEMDGTRVKFQRLIFCGRPLENQSDLKSCGVVDGSVVYFENTKEAHIQVNVKNLAGSLFTLECDKNDTVADLKNKIVNVENMDFDSIRLLFAGKQLQDEQHLHYYNIENESVVRIAARLRGGLSVNVRVSDGRSFSFGEFDTIGELKQKIREKAGIPVYNQVLLLNGKILEDATRNEDLNIENNCTIDVIILKGG